MELILCPIQALFLLKHPEVRQFGPSARQQRAAGVTQHGTPRFSALPQYSPAVFPTYLTPQSPTHTVTKSLTSQPCSVLPPPPTLPQSPIPVARTPSGSHGHYKRFPS
ncbi:uncharacterized protein LOC122242683 [Penaeus japonicus]|uniref:uncharacterized protein LOC122242683 n=1 Tax=Penaeus japonicus TaxID=27405 RepID=UPI001C70C9EB|nr:uncharacterized protein LOC122242683 [Penaeus japonicus]